MGDITIFGQNSLNLNWQDHNDKPMSGAGFLVDLNQ